MGPTRCWSACVWLLASLAAACGDEVAPVTSGPTGPDDSDGDGLTNDEERLIYGTSAVLPDTDGDGFDDYTEIVEYGFNPGVNPYKFNPLVADLPAVGIHITSPIEPFMSFTDADQVTRSFGTTRSEESAATVSTSEESSVSDTIEDSFSMSAELGVEFPVPKLSEKASATATARVSRETTVTNTTAQSWENRQALARAETYERSNEITQSGGGMMCTLMVENRGNLAFRVKTMIVSAYRVEPGVEDLFHPIGNLILDTNEYLAFPDFTIGPGQAVGPLDFINDHLDLATARSVFGDTRSVKLVPAIVELTDAEGMPFAFQLTEVAAKTALVSIDYAGLRGSESYFVATNAVPGSPGITAAEAMRILSIPYTAGAVTWGGVQTRGLSALRDDDRVRANETRRGYWILLHTRRTGLGVSGTGYDPLTAPYDFDTIELQAGDALHLVYLEDLDGDGLLRREELLRGSSDEDPDSDADGVQDHDETLAGLDPAAADSDGDLLRDGVDPDPAVANPFDVSAASGTTALVKADGSLWNWGDLGPSKASRPLEVGGYGWTKVSVGKSFLAGLKADHTIWTWGANPYGQLGLGYVDLTPVWHAPEWVSPDVDWVDVSAGKYTVQALKANGQQWAWGATGSGGGVENVIWVGSSSPVQVGSGARWVGVSSGEYAAAATRSDLSLWTAGRSLCSGVADTTSFVQLGTARDWVAVSMSAQGEFGLGIRADGTLHGWGRNDKGQLGTGDCYDSYYCAGGEPIAVSTGWRAVATGAYHSLGIRDDGTLWSWGLNEHGQLGLGRVDPWESPVMRPTRVSTEGPWVQVAAGYQHSLAVRDDGTVWAWGYNNDGQLGDGTNNDRTLPVCVTSVVPGAGCP